MCAVSLAIGFLAFLFLFRGCGKVCVALWVGLWSYDSIGLAGGRVVGVLGSGCTVCVVLARVVSSALDCALKADRRAIAFLFFLFFPRSRLYPGLSNTKTGQNERMIRGLFFRAFFIFALFSFYFPICATLRSPFATSQLNCQKALCLSHKSTCFPYLNWIRAYKILQNSKFMIPCCTNNTNCATYQNV